MLGNDWFAVWNHCQSNFPHFSLSFALNGSNFVMANQMNRLNIYETIPLMYMNYRQKLNAPILKFNDRLNESLAIMVRQRFSLAQSICTFLRFSCKVNIETALMSKSDNRFRSNAEKVLIIPPVYRQTNENCKISEN